MGPRTLRARLTARFAAIAGLALVVLAALAVTFTRRELERSDSTLALYRAETLDTSLDTELAEGDPIDVAAQEVAQEAHAERLRIAVLVSGSALHLPDPVPLDDQLAHVAQGSCTTLADENGSPWRACAFARGDDHLLVAAVEIAAHRDAVSTLARSMAVVVVLVIVVMLVLMRRALRAPLDEVTQLVSWTSLVGGTGAHVAPPPAATLEIENLGLAFDGLVKKLTAALDRERATSAHIAHELRTPLTALMADAALPVAAREDAARLSDVVDAILVLSDTGAERLQTLVNVADVVRSLAPKETRVEAPDEALTTGDERLVALAVRNLVENARKHAGGPPVCIRVSREQDRIRVSVIDEGPGATPEERAKMFERYWRGVADGPGRGLGLALVGAVAERHGGVAEARPGEKLGLEVGFTMAGVERWSS